MPQLIKMNNFFGQYLQVDCFEKPPYSLYSCHQSIETKEQQGFFPPQESNFALSLALLKHEVNKRGFIFEDVRWWSVADLATLIHSDSHFSSYLVLLEIAVGYRKLRSFQGTQVNVSVLLEKLDITYPSRNS